MAQVTLELLGEQMRRMFGELRDFRQEVDERLKRLEAAEERAVTKGDVVALFRGLELKIEGLIGGAT